MSQYGPERVVFDGETEFLKIVRARVHAALDGADPRGNPRQIRKAALVTDEGLLMTPRRTDTDGFFVSLLRRSA